MTINRYNFTLVGNYIVIDCVNFSDVFFAETLVRKIFIPITSRIITDVTEIDGRAEVNNLMFLLDNTALVSINRYYEKMIDSDLEPQRGNPMADFFWIGQQINFDMVIDNVARYTGVTMVQQITPPIDLPLKQL